MGLQLNELKTPAGIIRVRRATPADHPDVVHIMNEAAARLATRGIDQWPSPLPPRWQDKLARSLAARTLYLAQTKEGNRPVGIVRLIWEDPYWPPGNDAGYIHTLAIVDAFTGQGVGAALLNWAEGAIKRQGRQLARLDCRADNEALRRYYAEQGYHFVREVRDRDYFGALFEKRVKPV